MKNLNLGLLIIRISVGGLMLFHGIAKLSGIQEIKNMLVENGIPGFVGYGVYIGEIIAPLALLLGYRTKIAGLIIFINCVFALLLVHSSDIFALSDKGAWKVELLGMYMFGSLALVFTGAGKYAVSKSSIWD